MSATYNQGIPTSSNGGIAFEPMPLTAHTGTSYQNGWALDPLGMVYFTDVGLNDVPSTATFHNGIAFASNGAVYTTTDTSGTNFRTRGGWLVRSDGALIVGTNTTTANAFNGGIGFSTSGYVFPGSDGVSFSADLIASLVPGMAIGSATPTFTHATTAYQTDFEGKQNLVLSGEARFQGARRVQNLLGLASVSTEDNQDADWTKTSCTTTATVVTFTDSSAGEIYNGTVINLGSSPNGRTFVYTVELTAGTASSVYFGTTDNGSWGAGRAMQIGPLTLTGTPQRFSFSHTFSGAVGNNINVVVGLPAKQGQLAGNQPTGTVTVTKWAVYEVTGQTNTNPPEYVSYGVLSAPYHGAGVDGVKYFDTLNGNTVASNVVTEVTGAAINSSEAACAGGVAAGVVDASGPIGYRAEGARADVLGTTAAIRRTMTDVGWVNGGTVTVATATGVDGVAAAAAKLTFGAVQATNTMLFTTVLGAAVRTYSAWITRSVGTGTIEMTKDGGTTWTDITSQLSTTPKLVQVVTASAANPIVGFRGATNADAIIVDFNTLEAATFANPTPIPLNVSKAADIDQYVSAGNISSTATSLTMELTPAATLTAATEYFHWASYVDADNYTAILSDGTNLIARKRIGAASNDAVIAWDRASGTLAKIGARFDTTNGVDIWLNGTKGTPDTTTTASQIGAAFQVGADGNGANQDFSDHRLLGEYSVSLSDSKMAVLTT